MSFFDFGSNLIGWLAWAAVFFLPGLLVTFALPLRGFSFWTKAVLGCTLSPLVVAIEFYGLRLCGMDFGTIAFVLPLLNLPAVPLVLLQRATIVLPQARAFLLGACVLLVPLTLLAPQIVDSRVRLFTGHSWMQTDIAYMLTDGELVLEEPELAGIRLVYPAGIHPYQALLSYSIDSSPASSYLWTNLAWLLLIFLLVVMIVSELGGDLYAKLGSFVLLCFGLNVVGYVVFVMLPAIAAGDFLAHGPYRYAWIGGDYRITPWLLKYFFFEQNIMGQALLAGVALLLIQKLRTNWKVDELILLTLLLIAIGLIYPAHYPPALMLVLFAGAVNVWVRRESDRTSILGLAASAAIATLVSFAYLKFLMLDRVTPSILFPTLDVRSFKYLGVKLVGATVSVSVFVVTIGLVLRWLFREHRDASWILLGGAVSSAAMYVVLEIVGPSAEYKYLLVSALFFAPLSALAIQRLLSRNARLLVPLSIIGSLVLVLPALHKVYTDFPWIPPWRLPAVEDSGYELRLQSEEEYSKVVEVIRESTPSNSIVVVERCDVYLPVLTHRKLYAPPLQERPHPGIFLMSSLLLEQQKGYGKGIVDARRTTVRELFNSNDGARIGEAVDEISSLHRPVAVVLSTPQNLSLQDWLRNSGRASKLFGDENKEVWLIGAS